MKTYSRYLCRRIVQCTHALLFCAIAASTQATVIDLTVTDIAVDPMGFNVPVMVTISVSNLGDMALTSDFEVLLDGLTIPIETNFDATGDVVTIVLSSGDPFAPSSTRFVSFLWTPRMNSGDLASLRATVDPDNLINEANENNNARVEQFAIAVPEPSTLALLGVGLLGLAFARPRKTA